MRRLVISVVVLLLLCPLFTGCATSRKNHEQLKGLMLLENLQLGRNKAYYSKHNLKTKRIAYRKFRKNSRNL